jgi:F-type H+-transporting ATPase subunit b
MEILHQLAELFLEAVPTVVIVFLFYLFLRVSFFKPLQNAMDERTRRIDGAKAEAAAAQAAAKDEMARYHDALKKARAEIYAEQDAKRQVTLEERSRVLRAVRSRAQESIQGAKERIATEFAAARGEIEKQAPALANDIARMILEGAGPSAGDRP